MTPATQGFSQDQQEYLAAVLTQLKLHRAFQNGAPGGSAEPEEELWYGLPLEDLCKEELGKHALHPLDMWHLVEKWTDEDKIAEGLDQFRMRHWGFFNVEPTSPGYMIRMRLPASIIRGDQMIVMGDIAENLAGGYAHVTTRGSLQLREIRPKHTLDVLQSLNDAGLSCHGSGADSARNMTASPTAGFDPVELIDLHKYTIRLSNLVARTRELQAIPRKFNISFDNGGSISAVSDTNDIGFVAVKVGDNPDGVEPGIYCRILLGGITGHKDFARDTGVICRPEDTVKIGEAMLRVFVDHGDRTNRKKARLKYVLDKHGFDWFIERTREKLAEREMQAELITLADSYDAPRPPINRQGHIGIHPQTGDDLYYVGVAMEVGRLSPEQMRVLGRIAQRYGNNDLRLTVWQNVLIPHVHSDDLDAVQDELKSVGLSANASAFAAGAVACTGKWGCKLASSHTKEAATSLVRHLESRFTLDSPINIHFTGCPNSCAQHYIGDLGFVGAGMPDGREGYNIVLGGGCDNDRGLARDLCGPVAADDINSLIEHIVGIYLQHRQGTETFLEFTRRHDDLSLRNLLLPQELAA